MARSRIELYWTSIETAPPDVALQVRVSDGSSDYLLPFSLPAYRRWLLISTVRRSFIVVIP